MALSEPITEFRGISRRIFVDSAKSLQDMQSLWVERRGRALALHSQIDKISSYHGSQCILRKGLKPRSLFPKLTRSRHVQTQSLLLGESSFSKKPLVSRKQYT